MALGGGTFLTQNKALPGTYVNFVSLASSQAELSSRGVGAIPMELKWGPENEVFTVTAEEFQKDSLKIFGFPYTDDELLPIREIFTGLKKCHFYRLNGGNTASNSFAQAKYSGTVGNKLAVKITENEDSTAQTPLYDVYTYWNDELVDMQQAVSEMSDLKDNDFVIWNMSAEIDDTAKTFLSGGTDGSAETVDYQDFLDSIESYSFNTLALASTDETLKKLFYNFTKRMRDDNGVKFQCVLYKYSAADFEGIISVENAVINFVKSGQISIGNSAVSAIQGISVGSYIKLSNSQYTICQSTDTGAIKVVEDKSPNLVYWTLGAQAGCQVNNSLTNLKYTGEYEVDTGYTQAQLEQAINSGKFIFHSVDREVRVLEDINTFISVDAAKDESFSANQTIRVLDQIGMDIASIFNTKYLGKIPNDNAGRISLWNDIVTHHRQLEAIRAIEDFDPAEVTVEMGNSKKTVVITDYVTPVNAMSKLYMTVVVE